MEFRRFTKLPETARVKRLNLSYRALMQAVKDAAGEWIEVDAGQVTGKTTKAKTQTLYCAAWYRKIVVKVAHGEDGKVYVRLAEPDEVAHA